MKVPLKWLGEYVGLSLSHAKLVERLTLAGLEVTGARVIGLPVPEGLRIKPEDEGPVWDDKIVIAQIRSIDRHPNADKLTLPTVEYGPGKVKTIVTGATNVKVGEWGQKVILALPGAKLFDGHSKEKKLVELKPKDMRGVPNDAMVCSAYELGISDEHEGIIILENDAQVGRSPTDLLGDIVLEIDVTPNMARCLSILGIAGEVAALTGGELRRPKPGVENSGESIEGQVQVVIENSKLSARYLAMIVKGVKIGPSPGWMQRRLTFAGMRPINNLVDITNYVMLEWGQPLHAFDFEVLRKRVAGKGPVITVRPARQGESLVTLDDQKRELTPEHLVIADAAGPIALAGVMGGKETEVSATTTNILLESANFDFVSIRRTMRAFDLPSEASLRFSKGIHPDLVRPAAERAADLMRRHAGGKVCQGVVDRYPGSSPPHGISLELEEVRKVLGVNMSSKDIVHILEKLEFNVEEDAPETMLVRPPTTRLDIQAGSADLIEELARIYGYDRLPATLMADQLPEQHTNRDLVLEERVRDLLVSAGLQEVITYSLTMPEREDPLGLPPGGHVKLQNPISVERSVLRRSLLPGVLEITAENLKHTADVRVFEVGAVFLQREGQKLPDEPRRLGIVMTGRRSPSFWSEGASGANAPLDFYDLKGVVETLAGDLHLPEVSYRPAKLAHLHPARSAELLVKGQPVGTFGEMHPRVAQKGFTLGNRMVLAGELDLEAILKAVPDRYAYTPVPRFPAALRDIAAIVAEATPAEQVEAEIRTGGGELLRCVRLFDLYRGPSIPAGTKSLAYALTYQADDRTLTDKEVNKAHEKVEGRLKHVLKAQIRGEDR